MVGSKIGRLLTLLKIVCLRQIPAFFLFVTFVSLPLLPIVLQPSSASKAVVLKQEGSNLSSKKLLAIVARAAKGAVSATQFRKLISKTKTYIEEKLGPDGVGALEDALRITLKRIKVQELEITGFDQVLGQTYVTILNQFPALRSYFQTNYFSFLTGLRKVAIDVLGERKFNKMLNAAFNAFEEGKADDTSTIVFGAIGGSLLLAGASTFGYWFIKTKKQLG